MSAFPDVSHTVSAWVWPVEGGNRVRVDWFDSDGLLIQSVPRDVDAAPGRWSRISFNIPAPGAANSATVTLATIGTRPLLSRWDDVTIMAATPRAVPGLRTRTIAKLDGFMTTTTSRVVTVSSRPQLVTVVSGEPATFQVVDLQTGALIHRSELPGLTNGWAITTVPPAIGANGGSAGTHVFLGGGGGHVWRYDTLTQTMSDLGRATPQATLIWDLVTDKNGIVWGASYPKAQLWSLDPATGSFTLRGPVSETSAYARGLAVDDEYLFVGTGPDRPHIVMLPIRGGGPAVQIQPPKAIANGFVKQLARRGKFLFAGFTGDVYGLYDLTTRKWTTLGGLPEASKAQVPSAAPAGASFYYVQGGVLWKVAGSGPGSGIATAIARTSLPGRNSLSRAQPFKASPGMADHARRRPSSQRRDLSALPRPIAGQQLPLAAFKGFRLRLEPSALHIKSLAAGNDGRVYVGGFGGPSLVGFTLEGDVALRYPPPDDQSPRLFGEIEGMVANGPHMYLGSYTGARILRYDTSQPWSPETNPFQIGSLGPSFRQDRPQAWAVDGARTYFGTVPTYGTLGGALGWIDSPSPPPYRFVHPYPKKAS